MQHRFRSLCAYLALAAALTPAWPDLELLAPLLMLASILAGWRDLRRIPKALLMAVGIGAVAAAIRAPHALIDAMGNTARLSALVIAVILLSATLGQSRDLSALSGSLVSGLPLSRYLGITFATGLLAVPLNFGSVGVMSTMIGRAKAARGDSALTRNAARAVLRGFALASIASPLSISVVITLTFLPGLRLGELIAMSLPFAIGFMLLGAAFRESEVSHAPAVAVTPGHAAVDSSAHSWSPWLRLGACIVAICWGAWALTQWGGMRYSRAVAMSCVGAVALVLLLRRTRGEPAALPSLASVGNELAIMGGSAFLGVLMGSAGAALLGADFGLPAWASPMAAFAVPWLLFLGGMMGLNPIVTGTLTGAVLAPIWPPSALLGLGFAMVSGWGLTVAGTPYSANSLLLNRITGYDAMTAALRWNLPLSIVSLLLAGALAAGLTYRQLPGA